MENTRNKRVGIGQKPRGKQAQSGFEAPSQEKEVAVAAGQERGVNDPVLEAVEGIDRGDGLAVEKSPISDKTEKTEENPTVAISEDLELEAILKQSALEGVPIVEVLEGPNGAGTERPAETEQQNRELGEQPDGSFNVVVRLEEGYIEPVRQWAEAEGISVQEWCSRQLSHYLETWGQPAKSR